MATSGSGASGCARAGVDEIDSLLAALQNPSPVVRDAALRVCMTDNGVLAVECHYVYRDIRSLSSLC